MTRRGCTIERREETDYHQTYPSVAGCTQAIYNSVLKISNVNPPSRHSPRLKAINAIYKAEDAMSSNLQQTSVDDSPSSNQIKVESDPADPIINVTLKDLQKRCKSRKRKAPKSIGSSTSDLNRTLLKPKEDEGDLEEPLICLKLKKSNKYSMGKQSKQSHPSESILPVEERMLQTPYQSFCRKESSSPVKTDSSSNAEEVAAEDERNSIPESVNNNLEVSSDKDPLHVGGPNIISTIKSEIAETCNAFISSSVFIDDCYTLRGSTRKLSQKFCEEESADGESYSFPRKFLHPCVNSHMETASCYSTPTQMGASPLVNISQSVNEVKGEGIGIDPLAHNSVSASSDLNFIEKFNGLGNSSSELHERIDGSELENGNTTNFMTESPDCCTNESSFEVMEVDNCTSLPESSKKNLDCCVNGVSIEFMETDNYTSPPESGKEHCGEKIEVDSSEMSCNKLLPSVYKSEMPSVSESETPTLYADNSELVSINEDLSLDVCSRARNFNITPEEVLCDCIMNQMDSLATSDIQEIKSESNSLESRMGKEFENKGDDIPVLKAPVCSRDNNVITKCSILSRTIYDFHSSFSGEVGSLDSLVLKALGSNASRNNNENHVLSHVEKGFFVGTYNCCDPHSSFSSPFDTHAANASSPGTESLHCSTMNKMSNHYRENAAYSEVDAKELIYSHIEKSFLVGMYDLCIPRDSNTSFSSGCDSYAANESTPESESSQCSTVDQTLHSCAEKAANSPEISAEELVEALECHSPQDSFPGPGAVNGLLNVEDSLSKASKRNQYSAENTLYRSIDMPSCHSSETSNLVEVEGSNMENELKYDQGVKVEHPPKNLLSNRKDLSPTSQEKLRRAFNGNKLGDVKKTASHEESSERMTKKSKSHKNGSLQTLSKGILKSQDRNCSCSKNSLIHTQVQKAVTFSQRQMQDVEKIATQLLKGLTSMKNIMIGSVGSEACSSASSNFTSEEINMAIEDASNLETTTKKWLSMMARDCNRFCKIMKSTENKGDAASVSVRKQPKKITFADEAGGLLCHVKIFQELPEMMNS